MKRNLAFILLLCSLVWNAQTTSQTTSRAPCAGFGLANSLIDSDGDGIFDDCDLDDDNDGIPDTVECSNTVNDMLYYANTVGLSQIRPSDFGLGNSVRNINITRDLSSKFGYPANSGVLIISITNASTHPIDDEWWTKGGEQPSVWNITGSLSAFVLMAQDVNYYTNDSKTIHIYDDAAVIPVTMIPGLENQTPVPGVWATSETISEKTLFNLTTDPEIDIGNWRFINLNYGPKSFGFSTTVVFADPVYVVQMYLECDTDRDGIPDRLDLDSDNDGCIDAIEGDKNVLSNEVQAASGNLTVGFGSSASNQNLGNDVDANGIPLMINGGQNIGDSQNAAVNACICYRPGTTTGTPEATQHGITALGRSGSNPENWPIVRNGGWTALEAKTKGFVINRITSTALVEAIANPVTGMMVFDEEADCLKININGTVTGWRCFNNQACP